MLDWISGALMLAGATLALLAGVGVEISFVIRALSIGAFMMLTTAVSAHVIARAAARSGAPLWNGTRIDERPTNMPESEK
jgi:multicomponent Na+:H+ antiporter subunit G